MGGALLSRIVHPVLVVGGSLAGLAVAARLAKAGHPVQLWEATDTLGGRFAARPGPQGVLVDRAPAIIGFPAPWRDLFRKSGRTLEAELARTRAELAPAAAARYDFADGSSFDLPTDRGEQLSAMTSAYGAATAERWRDLLDWLDDVWQAVRPLGLERELTDASQLSRPVRELLRPHQTVADLAAAFGHPDLGAIIRSTAHRQGSSPDRAPAWTAVALSVERRFGRWTITAPAADARDRTGRTSTFVEALADRLVTRKVDVQHDRQLVGLRRDGQQLLARAADGTETLARRVVYAADPWQLDDLLPRTGLPWNPLNRLRRRLRHLAPARAPTVRHALEPATGPQSVSESVRLTADGIPTITYARPTRAGVLTSTHDHATATPDPSAGVAWHGFDSWFARPPIRTELPGLMIAGPSTAAGGDLSATLLAGALASYAAHATDS